MDGRWSANQFNTSTAISLITLLLGRNEFHLATEPAAVTQLEYLIYYKYSAQLQQMVV